MTHSKRAQLKRRIADEQTKADDYAAEAQDAQRSGRDDVAQRMSKIEAATRADKRRLILSL